jgi:hypothetical protein
MKATREELIKALERLRDVLEPLLPAMVAFEQETGCPITGITPHHNDGTITELSVDAEDSMPAQLFVQKESMVGLADKPSGEPINYSLYKGITCYPVPVDLEIQFDHFKIENRGWALGWLQLKLDQVEEEGKTMTEKALQRDLRTAKLFINAKGDSVIYTPPNMTENKP